MRLAGLWWARSESHVDSHGGEKWRTRAPRGGRDRVESLTPQPGADVGGRFRPDWKCGMGHDREQDAAPFVTTR